MGQHADDAINDMLHRDERMLDSLFDYSYQPPRKKPAPKARDLRRLAGKLSDLTQTEEPKT